MTDGKGDSGRAESISWLELFFDLVVVAAVSVLADSLRADLTAHGLGVTVLVYVAIWTSWTLAVFYANVAREKTRVRTMTFAMFLIALMTASAPLHDSARANLFAAAYIVLRLLLARSSLETGRFLDNFPGLQQTGAILPWVVSFWFDTPGKYWAWAVGAAIDLVLSVLRADEVSGRNLARLNQKRHDDHRGHRVPDLVVVDIDRHHLDERLGLFIIIVLGEAVVQLVQAAATAEWTTDFEWVAVASFILLVGLWRTTFAHGFTGAPHTSLADLPPRFGLPLHLVSTLGLVLLATGLSILLTESGAGHVEPAVGWLVAGGMAAHLGVALVAGLSARTAGWEWVLLFAGTATLYAVVLGFLAPHLLPVSFAWLAVVPAVWQATIGEQLSQRRSVAMASAAGLQPREG